MNRESSRAIRLILSLPRPAKRMVALGIDAAICGLTVYLAFYLRLGVLVDPLVGPPHPTMGAIAIALPLFVSMGLYRAIFRHAGSEAIVSVGRAVAIYSVPYALIYSVIGVSGVPRTIGLIQPILLFLFVSASRLLARAYLGDTYAQLWNSEKQPRVMIYGAGRAGRQLASAIRESGEMRLVGMVDDDRDLWRSTINGIQVFSPDELSGVVKKRQVTDILLALPSASRARRGEIVNALRGLNLHVRTLPGVIDLARGSVSTGDLRDLGIDDLLGRPQVPPDPRLIRRNITGKTVLVTGAGGSIGSELCRQILRGEPAKVILLEQAEYNLYAIHRELMALAEAIQFDETCLVPILGSVCDERRIDEVLDCYRPDTIFHAAAYKHVPLVEHNAIEGIRNNTFGTLAMARAAERHGVSHFVLISTDKAVRPTNVMGTTKRLAEMVLQAMNEKGSSTSFSMVRFGNVLGSSGSVVPLFREQLAAGGPITVTDPEITRYFMTIPEAAQLVLQAGAMARGGDVFLLDMGDPVRIVDLARNMIELSGCKVRDDDNPDGDIEIAFVGLRPGEKLYEELLIGEHPLPTEHPRIMRSREAFLPWDGLRAGLDELGAAILAGDAAAARALIMKLVPEFAPSSPLVDWIGTARVEARSEVARTPAALPVEPRPGASITPIGNARR